MKCLTLAVTLILNTAIQYFHWTLFCLWWTYHQSEFGCKRLISLEVMKDTAESCILIICDCNLENNILIFFIWHSGSWWCTTMPNLVMKGWAIQKISFEQSQKNGQTDEYRYTDSTILPQLPYKSGEMTAVKTQPTQNKHLPHTLQTSWWWFVC